MKVKLSRWEADFLLKCIGLNHGWSNTRDKGRVEQLRNKLKKV